MLECVTDIVVRYAETDMMGIVYHANYLTWLEIGRTQLLRDNGLPYKDIEAQGLYLPVLEVSVKYRRPATYDDPVTIVTRMREKPFVKIHLEYDVKRGEDLLATATSVHAFMNSDGQAVRVPAFFNDAMVPFFELPNKTSSRTS